MAENNAAVVEATPPVVEVPPEVKERQETDAYIEQRQKARSAPPPEVKIDTTTPAEADKKDAAPPDHQSQINEVDAYLREKEAGRKRKNRGGVQARIDELTKKTAAIDELAKKTAELEQKVSKSPEVTPPQPPPAVAEASKAVETPKTQPKMADYTDIDKYNADLALWAASQTHPAAIPEPPKPVTPPPAEPEPVQQIRKEEFDRFLERGKQLMTRYPDFNTVLEAAHIRGLTMSEQARVAITKLAMPEVAYWLAKPENDMAARALMKMDDIQQVVEVGKIAERLAVKPSDFVSNAPEPGTRLAGGTTRAIANDIYNINDTDDYIRERRMQRKGARR